MLRVLLQHRDFFELVLDFVHGIDELFLGLGNLLVLGLETQVDQLLSLNDGVDGGVDVWAFLVDSLECLQSLGDDFDVLFAFEAALEKSEEIIDLVLVVVDITHGLKSSDDILEVLVELLGSVTDVVHSSCIEIVDFVAELIQVVVESVELVLWLPVAKLMLAGIQGLVNELVLVKNVLLHFRICRLQCSTWL